MALKDWKKVRINEWTNNKNKKTLLIENTTASYFTSNDEYDYKYLVYIQGYKFNGDGFKTKSQALKFAKQYMRTH